LPDQTVQRIAAGTGEVQATKSSLGTPTGIAWGEDAVWITNGVLRYDPATGEQSAVIKLDEGSLPSYLALGTGAAEGIWVVNELAGTVARIDPRRSTLRPP
jgi:streptogramin lyase